MVQRIEDTNQIDLDLPDIPRDFAPPDGWNPGADLPELFGLVGFDFETKDPGIKQGTGSSWPYQSEGHVCGLGIDSDQGSFYLPVYHAAGNMDPMRFWPWLRKQVAKPDVTLLMANSIYDTGWLARHGITPTNNPIDVQAMAYLINENRPSLSLNALAREYLGLSKKTDGLKEAARKVNIADPMANMDKLPAWVVAPYGAFDAKLTRLLYYKLIPLIAADDLGNVLELERESAMVAVDLRMRGVRVNLERAQKLREVFLLTRDGALDLIRQQTGIVMEPFETEAAIRALRIENPRVQLGRTDNGNDSVAQHVLKTINSPVANALLTARQNDKLISTFIDGYILQFGAARGRIHAEFHPTRNAEKFSEANDSDSGATTGRFACSNPNLQNIPIRSEEGLLIRECFLPEEGETWAKVDWASQEPRLTLHFAYKARCRGASDMVQRFLDNPKTDVHAECAALMGIDRSRAKIINLALAYGMQGAALCRSLGLPTKWIRSRRTGDMIEVAGEEGQALLDRHYATVPYIREIFDLGKATAEQRGYIRTLSGRRIHFERYPDGNVVRSHKGLNAAVQGSAADQMKNALGMLRHADIPVLVTVHDEAGISLPPGAEGERRLERVLDIMAQALPICVPMVADHKIGPNWGQVK